MVSTVADAVVTMEAAQTCTSGHALVRFVTPGLGDCDRCGAEVPEGSAVLDCRKCNWFLCSSCSDPPSPPEVPAPSPNLAPATPEKPLTVDEEDPSSFVLAKVLEETETNSEGRTVFTVEVSLPDGRSSRVQRAYHEFRSLRDGLEGSQNEIPFPPKHFRRVSGDRLVQRRRELKEWLEQALSGRQTVSELDSAWQAFLSVSDSGNNASADTH